MHYTLRNTPEELDKALRERAHRERRSLNDVAIEALHQGAGLGDAPVKRRDLSDIVGTWADDPEVDRALEDQRCIDEAMWR